MPARGSDMARLELASLGADLGLGRSVGFGPGVGSGSGVDAVTSSVSDISPEPKVQRQSRKVNQGHNSKLEMNV